MVILVDEYDKPILDNLTREIGSQIRDSLRDFYSVIKAHDSQLRFVLLTGVSKFSKVSIFSGLNNLNDITLDSRYSALCGYTQTELESAFRPWLDGVDLPRVRDWYNGYGWDGERVYNPFDILLFLDKQHRYRPYWFETGTPTFLLEVLKKNWQYLPAYESYKVRMSELGTFDVGNIKFDTLLFQTGYLTLASVNDTVGDPICELSFPNTEVRSAFNQLVLSNYLLSATPEQSSIIEALQTQDLLAIESCFRNLFASIANDNYRNNAIANYEGYYASVVYAYLAAIGFPLTAEDVTHTGRIDLTLHVSAPHGKRIVYIFEFKVAKVGQAIGDSAQSALQQIHAKKYAEKYVNQQTEVYEIGIEFDPQTKTLSTFASSQA